MFNMCYCYQDYEPQYFVLREADPLAVVPIDVVERWWCDLRMACNFNHINLEDFK